MSDRFEIVPFHQHQIMTVKTDDAILVVMKPIVESFGLHWHAQRERIHRHPVLSEGARVIRVPSAGGMQEAMALDLEQFHGWLITLAPDRIKDEAKRELIVRYQREAFRVVFEHFHGKMGKPPRTVKSVGVTIATQNQIMKLIRRLQATYHPQERRALHQMLDGMCQDIGIDTPALDQLGSDAPLVPDTLDKFWRAVDTLQERGYEVNMSRTSKVIALHLKSLAEALDAEKLGVRIDTEMRRALEHSTSPKFIARKPVNRKDKKIMHCWVFERSAYNQ